jgi:hypothetical protein
MNAQRALSIIAFCSTMFFAQCRAEKALWIEVKEDGKRTATIAMTEGIARKFLETKEMNVNFTEKGRHDLITRDMLHSVLNGQKRSVTAHDENGSEAVVSLKSLTIPGERSGNNHLVLETYKSGNRTFRMVLPELEFEQAGDKGDEYVKVNFSWKALLPFLEDVGGAVYINDQDDDTEVWIFVD